jgi:hypothetical protein
VPLGLKIRASGIEGLLLNLVKTRRKKNERKAKEKLINHKENIKGREGIRIITKGSIEARRREGLRGARTELSETLRAH